MLIKFFEILLYIQKLFKGYCENALYRKFHKVVSNDNLYMDFNCAVINLGITSSPEATNEKFPKRG